MFTVRIAPAEQLGGIDVLDRVEDIRFDLRVVCRERRDQLLDFRAFGVAFQLFCRTVARQKGQTQSKTLCSRVKYSGRISSMPS